VLADCFRQPLPNRLPGKQRSGAGPLPERLWNVANRDLGRFVRAIIFRCLQGLHRGTIMRKVRSIRQAESLRTKEVVLVSRKKTTVFVNEELEDAVRQKGVMLRLYDWQACVERALQDWVAPPSTVGLDPRIARIADILGRPGNLETFRKILLTIAEDERKI
jgi:hypothetical protein